MSEEKEKDKTGEENSNAAEVGKGIRSSYHRQWV